MSLSLETSFTHAQIFASGRNLTEPFAFFQQAGFLSDVGEILNKPFHLLLIFIAIEMEKAYNNHYYNCQEIDRQDKPG